MRASRAVPGLAFWLQVLARLRAEIERGLSETILRVLVESLPDFFGHAGRSMQLALGAREVVDNVPSDLLVTADDILPLP